MSPEELKNKVDDLLRRHEAVIKKKAGLGGQLQAKKEELAQVLQEAKAAGYDPKNLASERDKAQKDLENLVSDFEKKLVEVEGAFATFDKK